MRGRGKREGGGIRPVRVGVVGAGALGFHHIRLLKTIDGADLVGFYDHNPTRAPYVAKELETTAFPSLEALLDQARSAFSDKAAHAAAKQTATRQLDHSLSEGLRLATVLRLAVKAHYGIRSEKLVEFGLQPFRGRPAAEVEEPTPPPVEEEPPSPPVE